MENLNNNPMNNEQFWRDAEKSHRRGKIVTGIIIIAVGFVFLLRELGIYLPGWLISWKMLLIVVGLSIGFKHSFRNPGWFFPFAIGSGFLIADAFPDMINKHFLWPILLILFGFFMLIRPKKFNWYKYMKHNEKHAVNMGTAKPYNDITSDTPGENYLDYVAVFGSIKKNILSKKLKGGEVVTVFGGADLNLSQADFEGAICIDIVQFFGGTTLIVPSNWEIKSELAAVFGGIEDKRAISSNMPSSPNKILVLRGTSVFGGIEIKNF